MANSKKLLQTKLQFNPQAPVAAMATNGDTNNIDLTIEEKVDRLKIGSKHKEICPTLFCKENRTKIVCEFLKSDGSPCGLAWCNDCISQFANENLPDVMKTSSWKCPVCRNVCKCAACKQGTHASPSLNGNLNGNRKPSGDSKRLKYGLSMWSVPPPPFSRISLAYSEEEIWFRLQIREFLYQFGDTCQMDSRMIMGLQNVQGDWRIRRLSGVLVWQALKVIGFSNNQGQEGGGGGIGNQTVIDDKIQRLARDTINSWATDFGLTRTAIPNTAERLERAGEIMTSKGMNCSRWQDVAELLAKANYKNLPIPTTTSTAEPADVNMNSGIDNSSSDNDNDDEAMDTSSEYEDSDQDDDDHDVEKFRELRRSPLSTEQELHLVQMVLDLLLLHGKIRYDMMETTTTKDLKAAEDELKMATKAFEAEDIRRKSNRNNLMMRIDQFRALGDQTMCMVLETEMKDLCQAIESSRAQMDRRLLDALAAQLRYSKKRLQRLITPWDGNEYWLFHDLLTPHQHYNGNRAEKNCKERWWAHGVIMIGKCPSPEEEDNYNNISSSTTELDENNSDNSSRWWHLDGIENIQKLDKWIVNCLSKKKQKGMDRLLWDTAEKDIDTFRGHLAQRINYLRLLERNVYGAGFFSQN